jgi:ABC-type branched-subunit amino acid transport system ATPase component/ABC-type branched-subunit amino acid transport system permease subunit
VTRRARLPSPPALPAWQRRPLLAVGVVVAWLGLGAVAPNGLPLGVVMLGVVLGSLTGLTAMGLVLVYRASRVVNFAQAEFGGLAATVAVVLTQGTGLPLWAGMLLGLVAALVTGVLAHELVVRRLFRAPRLILTVATIGVAQLVAAGEIFLPRVYTQLRPLNTFHTSLPVHFRLGPIFFGSDHVLVLVVVFVVLVGLGVFLTKSDVGIAVRGAAESPDRALLLGIPVRRLSLLAWTLAAGLSGVGSLLSAPVLGPEIGVASGPLVLMAPLVAAVIARMESLPVAYVAGVGLGIAQQSIFWNYPRSSTVDVALFAVVLVALLAQRKRLSRTDDGGLGDHVAVREVRPVPAQLRALPEVRRARAAGVGLLVVVLLGLPLVVSDPHRGLLAYVAINCIVAASLVVLTGWSGQISLGQFAFVGLGAGTTGSMLVHLHADLFLSLVASAAGGGLAAILVGIPALRIRGLFLAVTTLAFGVPVSTFLLNSAYVPDFTPSTVPRPLLLSRFSLDDPLTFAYLCILVAIACVVLARNFRDGRVGRIVVAVRDNERAASTFGVEPVRAKLTAFAFSGALAGVAGGLYVVGLRGIPFSGFDPEQSLVVFTMVIIGGAASLPGALLGAVYVQGAQYFLSGPMQLLATGAGLLVLVLFFPGGLGQLAFSLRDRWLRRVANRRGLSVPALREQPDLPQQPVAAVAPTDGLLSVNGVEAAYGKSPVLFGVDLAAVEGGIMALLGTNGAGKSTVLRVVAGLLPASRGRVLFDGRDITDLDPIARVKAGIALVPGGRGVFGSLTVRDNLRLAAWLYRRDAAAFRQQLERVVTLFPVLRDRLDVAAGDLSGGQQQMVAIAQGLISRPRLLMIDELSLGLAPTVVADLLAVIRQVNRDGTTVVIVEQSVNLATTMADVAVFLEKGQVRFAGRTAELAERDDIVRAVFLRADGAAIASEPRRRPSDDAVPRMQVRGVGVSFGGVRAVDDVDLEVVDAGIVGIIGSNGAGKTTLFDLCSGFVTPDRGRVVLDGVDVTSSTAAERAARGLGRTFQDARLFASMTVREVLATALERHLGVREPVAYVFRVGAVTDSEADVAYTVDELLDLMNLGRYGDSFISELSTGTRRIVELGCAIAHAPRVLLLDEPSSGIAQREVEALRDVLLQVRADTGAALAVVEHDIPLLSSMCDSMVCMHLGRVIARGTPDEVLADPLVVSSYLGTDASAIERSGTRTRGGRRASATRVNEPRLATVKA